MFKVEVNILDYTSSSSFCFAKNANEKAKHSRRINPSLKHPHRSYSVVFASSPCTCADVTHVLQKPPEWLTEASKLSTGVGDCLFIHTTRLVGNQPPGVSRHMLLLT